MEGDSYEEYEWAGQRRIRATTMLQGGFAAAGMQTVCTKVTGVDEETEDVVVDGDDTATFGPAQFNESDVLSTMENSNSNCSPNGEGLSEGLPFAPFSILSMRHSFNSALICVNRTREFVRQRQCGGGGGSGGGGDRLGPQRSEMCC